MKLDIDRLHKEGKTERQSGRTTDMLAEVVGSALVSGKNKTILIVSIDAFDTWHHFIEVLRAIDPDVKYDRTIRSSAPCILIFNDSDAIVEVKFAYNPPWDYFEATNYETYIDHHWAERKERDDAKIMKGINKRIVLKPHSGTGFFISTTEPPEHHYWTKRLFMDSIPDESIPYKRYFIAYDPYIDDKIDPPLA